MTDAVCAPVAAAAAAAAAPWCCTKCDAVLAPASDGEGNWGSPSDPWEHKHRIFSGDAPGIARSSVSSEDRAMSSGTYELDVKLTCKQCGVLLHGCYYVRAGAARNKEKEGQYWISRPFGSTRDPAASKCPG